MSAKGGSAYHLRRSEKDMPERADQLAVIRGQKVLTLALCKEGEPYLVTMNYAFSEAENSFYLHCAPQGKKMDFIRADPRVWGQVVEDRGYAVGKCTHYYRCVMFEGVVEIVEDESEKRRALEMMIDHLEPEPAPLKARLLAQARIARTAILRLRVLHMTGKQNPVPLKT